MAIDGVMASAQTDAAMAGNNQAIGIILAGHVPDVLVVDALDLIAGGFAVVACRVRGFACLERGIDRSAIFADALAAIHRDTFDAIEHEDAGRFTAPYQCDVLLSAITQTTSMGLLTAELVFIAIVTVFALAAATRYPAAASTQKEHAKGRVARSDAGHVLWLASRGAADASSSPTQASAAARIAATGKAAAPARIACSRGAGSLVPYATRASRIGRRQSATRDACGAGVIADRAALS